MSDMTSEETAPEERPPVDLGPFFSRYDRRVRFLLGGGLCVALALSVAIAMRLNDQRLHAVGTPGLKGLPAIWTVGVVMGPLVITGWWIFCELIARGRRKGRPPAGPLPTSADDARNGVRIAHAGFLYTLALVAGLITEQLLMASMVFAYPIPGELIARAICVVVGGVTIYLGNLWPRMPTPRTADRKAIRRMQVNRFSGWFMVLVGLLVVALGVFLPLLVHRP